MAQGRYGRVLLRGLLNSPPPPRHPPRSHRRRMLRDPLALPRAPPPPPHTHTHTLTHTPSPLPPPPPSRPPPLPPLPPSPASILVEGPGEKKGFGGRRPGWRLRRQLAIPCGQYSLAPRERGLSAAVVLSLAKVLGEQAVPQACYSCSRASSFP